MSSWTNKGKSTWSQVLGGAQWGHVGIWPVTFEDFPHCLMVIADESNWTIMSHRHQRNQADTHKSYRRNHGIFLTDVVKKLEEGFRYGLLWAHGRIKKRTPGTWWLPARSTRNSQFLRFSMSLKLRPAAVRSRIWPLLCPLCGLALLGRWQGRRVSGWRCCCAKSVAVAAAAANWPL